MGVAKSDFSQMCRSRSDLIENAEHFAPIDLHGFMHFYCGKTTGKAEYVKCTRGGGTNLAGVQLPTPLPTINSHQNKQ